MNLLLRIVIPMLLVFGITTPSYAWLIYHKPTLKGKVIDTETKEPIVGAVVVAVYDKRAIRLAPHSVGIIMHAQETLTTKDGTFMIPSYTTITDPFSFDYMVTVFIYKPGYGRYPEQPGATYRVLPSGMSLIDHEPFFTKAIGSAGELELAIWEKGAFKYQKKKVPYGIVELPKLKTREERLKAMPSPPGDYTAQDLPLLYKAINDERKSFGLQEVGR